MVNYNRFKTCQPIFQDWLREGDCAWLITAIHYRSWQNKHTSIYYNVSSSVCLLERREESGRTIGARQTRRRRRRRRLYDINWMRDNTCNGFCALKIHVATSVEDQGSYLEDSILENRVAGVSILRRRTIYVCLFSFYFILRWWTPTTKRFLPGIPTILVEKKRNFAEIHQNNYILWPINLAEHLLQATTRDKRHWEQRPMRSERVTSLNSKWAVRWLLRMANASHSASASDKRLAERPSDRTTQLTWFQAAEKI